MADSRDIAWLRSSIARLETRLEQLERAFADRHQLEMARLSEILDQTMICSKELKMQQVASQRNRGALNTGDKLAIWDIPIPDLPTWGN